MRIGIELCHDGDLKAAVAADRAGLAVVAISPGAGAFVAAAALATLTRWCRIAVPVALGAEAPVTLAEDLAVLDQLSGGRVIAIVHGAASQRTALAELRLALAQRPFTPADSTRPIIVTPSPVQLQLPLWSTDPVAGLPRVAETTRHIDRDAAIAPGRTSTAIADVEAVAAEWAAAGATHLVLCPPPEEAAAVVESIARRAQPPHAMVGFAREISRAALPSLWPTSPPRGD